MSLSEETTVVTRELTEELFESLVSHLPDAVIFADVERRIQFVNDRFVEIFGYERTALEGRSTAFFYANPEDFNRTGRAHFDPEAKTGPQTYFIEYRRRDGSTFLSETRAVPLFNDAGEKHGYLGIIRDVTDLVERDKELRRVRNQLARRLAHTKLLYELSTLEGNTFQEVVHFALEAAGELLDMDVSILSSVRGDKLTVRDFWSRQSMSLKVGDTFDLDDTLCAHTLESGGVYAVHEIEWNSELLHPCHDHFRPKAYIGAVVRVGKQLYGTVSFARLTPRKLPFEQADEDFVGMLANWLGVFASRARTERMLASEHEAMSAALELQKTLQSSSLNRTDTADVFLESAATLVEVDGLAVALREDDETVITSANGSFAPLIGEVLPEIIIPRADTSHGDRPSLQTWHTSRRVSQIDEPIQIAELTYSGQSLGALLVQPSSKAKFEKRQRSLLELTAGMLAARLSVAGSYERAHRQATIDALTGIPNRRETLRCLKAAAEEPGRGALQVAIIDVDRFKQVNDTWGHGVGDRVLQKLANCLSEELSRALVVGRLGGEEFVIGLREPDVEAAHTQLTRALEAFSSVDFVSDDGEHFSVTFSGGVTIMRAQDSIYDALQRADELLYRAKRGGRAQVVAENREI
jgi:diguanylate cyclase (GGDEF)-like protein/PAS domain S-box-containing protein